VLPGMKVKIEQAVERLKEELVSSMLTAWGCWTNSSQESNKEGGGASEEAVAKAEDALGMWSGTGQL
jgi:hypothetical protein